MYWIIVRHDTWSNGKEAEELPRRYYADIVGSIVPIETFSELMLCFSVLK